MNYQVGITDNLAIAGSNILTENGILEEGYTEVIYENESWEDCLKFAIAHNKNVADGLEDGYELRVANVLIQNQTNMLG